MRMVINGDAHLPDEYRTPGVPFTRLTRPQASYTLAEHALEKHAHGAQPRERVTYYPQGFFGPGDDDIEAMRALMDRVTYEAEPTWDARRGLLFEGTMDGVRVLVPVKLALSGVGWEARSAIPIGGRGVTAYRNGRFWSVD